MTEAQGLLNAGILKAMISRPREDGLPKYVWSVSADKEVFEAKTDAHATGQYHGYPLNADDDMRDVILREWVAR